MHNLGLTLVLAVFVVLTQCLVAAPVDPSHIISDEGERSEEDLTPFCPQDDVDDGDIENIEPTYFPHSRNCSLYYECNKGKLVIELCGNGLFFNPDEKVCDFPQNVFCYQQQQEPTSSELTDKTEKKADTHLNAKNSVNAGKDEETGISITNFAGKSAPTYVITRKDSFLDVAEGNRTGDTFAHKGKNYDRQVQNLEKSPNMNIIFLPSRPNKKDEMPQVSAKSATHLLEAISEKLSKSKSTMPSSVLVSETMSQYEPMSNEHLGVMNPKNSMTESTFIKVPHQREENIDDFEPLLEFPMATDVSMFLNGAAHDGRDIERAYSDYARKVTRAIDLSNQAEEKVRTVKDDHNNESQSALTDKAIEPHENDKQSFHFTNNEAETNIRGSTGSKKQDDVTETPMHVTENPWEMQLLSSTASITSLQVNNYDTLSTTENEPVFLQKLDLINEKTPNALALGTRQPIFNSVENNNLETTSEVAVDNNGLSSAMPKDHKPETTTIVVDSTLQPIFSEQLTQLTSKTESQHTLSTSSGESPLDTTSEITKDTHDYSPTTAKSNTQESVKSITQTQTETKITVNPQTNSNEYNTRSSGQQTSLNSLPTTTPNFEITALETTSELTRDNLDYSSTTTKEQILDITEPTAGTTASVMKLAHTPQLKFNDYYMTSSDQQTLFTSPTESELSLSLTTSILEESSLDTTPKRTINNPDASSTSTKEDTTDLMESFPEATQRTIDIETTPLTNNDDSVALIIKKEQLTSSMESQMSIIEDINLESTSRITADYTYLLSTVGDSVADTVLQSTQNSNFNYQNFSSPEQPTELNSSTESQLPLSSTSSNVEEITLQSTSATNVDTLSVSINPTTMTGSFSETIKSKITLANATFNDDNERSSAQHALLASPDEIQSPLPSITSTLEVNTLESMPLPSDDTYDVSISTTKMTELVSKTTRSTVALDTVTFKDDNMTSSDQHAERASSIESHGFSSSTTSISDEITLEPTTVPWVDTLLIITTPKEPVAITTQNSIASATATEDDDVASSTESQPPSSLSGHIFKEIIIETTSGTKIGISDTPSTATKGNESTFVETILQTTQSITEANTLSTASASITDNKESLSHETELENPEPTRNTIELAGTTSEPISNVYTLTHSNQLLQLSSTTLRSKLEETALENGSTPIDGNHDIDSIATISVEPQHKTTQSTIGTIATLNEHKLSNSYDEIQPATSNENQFPLLSSMTILETTSETILVTSNYDEIQPATSNENQFPLLSSMTILETTSETILVTSNYSSAIQEENFAETTQNTIKWVETSHPPSPVISPPEREPELLTASAIIETSPSIEIFDLDDRKRRRKWSYGGSKSNNFILDQTKELENEGDSVEMTATPILSINTEPELNSNFDDHNSELNTIIDQGIARPVAPSLEAFTAENYQQTILSATVRQTPLLSTIDNFVEIRFEATTEPTVEKLVELLNRTESSPLTQVPLVLPSTSRSPLDDSSLKTASATTSDNHKLVSSIKGHLFSNIVPEEIVIASEMHTSSVTFLDNPNVETTSDTTLDNFQFLTTTQAEVMQTLISKPSSDISLEGISLERPQETSVEGSNYSLTTLSDQILNTTQLDSHAAQIVFDMTDNATIADQHTTNATTPTGNQPFSPFSLAILEEISLETTSQSIFHSTSSEIHETNVTATFVTTDDPILAIIYDQQIMTATTTESLLPQVSKVISEEIDNLEKPQGTFGDNEYLLSVPQVQDAEPFPQASGSFLLNEAITTTDHDLQASTADSQPEFSSPFSEAEEIMLDTTPEYYYLGNYDDSLPIPEEHKLGETLTTKQVPHATEGTTDDSSIELLTIPSKNIEDDCLTTESQLPQPVSLGEISLETTSGTNLLNPDVILAALLGISGSTSETSQSVLDIARTPITTRNKADMTITTQPTIHDSNLTIFDQQTQLSITHDSQFSMSLSLSTSSSEVLYLITTTATTEDSHDWPLGTDKEQKLETTEYSNETEQSRIEFTSPGKYALNTSTVSATHVSEILLETTPETTTETLSNQNILSTALKELDILQANHSRKRVVSTTQRTLDDTHERITYNPVSEGNEEISAEEQTYDDNLGPSLEKPIYDALKQLAEQLGTYSQYEKLSINDTDRSDNLALELRKSLISASKNNTEQKVYESSLNEEFASDSKVTMSGLENYKTAITDSKKYGTENNEKTIDSELLVSENLIMGQKSPIYPNELTNGENVHLQQVQEETLYLQSISTFNLNGLGLLCDKLEEKCITSKLTSESNAPAAIDSQDNDIDGKKTENDSIGSKIKPSKLLTTFADETNSGTPLITPTSTAIHSTTMETPTISQTYVAFEEAIEGSYVAQEENGISQNVSQVEQALFNVMDGSKCKEDKVSCYQSKFLQRKHELEDFEELNIFKGKNEEPQPIEIRAAGKDNYKSQNQATADNELKGDPQTVSEYIRSEGLQDSPNITTGREDKTFSAHPSSSYRDKEVVELPTELNDISLKEENATRNATSDKLATLLEETPNVPAIVPSELDYTDVNPLPDGKSADHELPIDGGTETHVDSSTVAKEQDENEGSNDAGSYYSPECQNKTYIPHECSPVQFYNCKSGRKIRMKCPDGLFYDRETTKCTWPPHGTCQMHFSPECDATSVYLADKDDPKSFYQCSNGMFYKFSCPRHLMFNRDLNVCDWPRDVGDEDTVDVGDSGDNNADSSKWPWPGSENRGSTENKNPWVPVVGAWPHPETVSQPPRVIENPNYPSVSLNGQKKEQITGSGRRNSDSDASAANVEVVTPSKPTRVLASQVAAARTTERYGSLPFNVDNSDISVSVDTSSGAINIASNHSDVLVHFKPSKAAVESSADVSIIKNLGGIMTVKTGIAAAREQGTNITLRLRERS